MKTLAKNFIYVTALLAAGFPATARAEQLLLHCTGTDSFTDYRLRSGHVITTTFEGSVVIDLTQNTYNSQPASINSMFITWDYTATNGSRVTGSLSRITGAYTESRKDNESGTELTGFCDKANPKF
jgi:hypothetical protein